MHSADEVNSIYKEANSIKKLRHKNIVELYHAFVEGKQLIMIMELARGGELMQYVSQKGALDEKDARHIMLQIVNAIQYCHANGVVHRDLKLENILFKEIEDLYVKVIDFGISGVCTTFQADMVDAGTVAYMPPECFEGPAVTSPALDVWAIGLMFYAMLYGQLPFWGETEAKTRQKIRQAVITFPREVPVTEEAKEVIRLMLTKDPEQRLGLLDFMNMDYYKYDDQEIGRIVTEVQERRAEEARREEEAKIEEQKLAESFKASLDLPSYGTYKHSAAGHRAGTSPNRAKPGRKKVGSKAKDGGSPRTGSSAAGSKTSHKNKKTTK